jgi:hypothetical protein
MVVALALSLSSSVQAGISESMFFLSDFSSDETDADMLDATLLFTVDEMANTLSLSVTNETMAPFLFNMNEVYFNLPDTVTDLTPVLVPDGWEFQTSTQVGGFGVFDVGLTTDAGSPNPAQIKPTEKLVFEFLFTGDATASDFTGAMSEGGNSMVAAAKFVNGPGDDSAYGAALPAPGAALALLLGLGIRGRRRRCPG